MLRKVFKYDIKSLWNSILTMLIVLLSLGLVGFGVRMFILRSQFHLDGFLFPGIGLYGLWLLTIVGIVAVGVSAAILILYRYYKSIFTDEGYLTMTLPVGTHALLLGKMFAALVYGAAVALALYVAYTLSSTLPTVFELLESGFLTDFWEYFTGEDIFGILSMNVQDAVFAVLDALFTVLRQFVLLYAAVTVGATVLKKAKLVGAGLFVFLISFLNSILSTLLSLLTMDAATPILSYGVDILFSVVVIFLCYYLTYFLLHRHFNIE